MASIDEVLAELIFVEKDSYRSLIEAGTENYVSEKVKFDILSSFMQGQVNRITAVRDLVIQKQTDSALSDNYTVFRDMIKKITGKNEDLDRWNGILSQTVYGDIRKQRERKREISEMTKRNTTIISEVTSRYDEFKTEMDNISSKLT